MRTETNTKTTLDNGIVVESAFVDKSPTRYYANSREIDGTTFNRLQGWGFPGCVNLKREYSYTTASEGKRWDTYRYLANGHEVDKQVYKALGGTIPSCEPCDCDCGGTTLHGTVTFAYCDGDSETKPAPKPKTRGEEVAEKMVSAGANDEIVVAAYHLKGAWNQGCHKENRRGLRIAIASAIDREIAAAEKRGEDRVKEKVRGMKHMLETIQASTLASEYYRGYMACNSADIGLLNRILE
jgi:hypothetical protein